MNNPAMTDDEAFANIRRIAGIQEDWRRGVDLNDAIDHLAAKIRGLEILLADERRTPGWRPISEAPRDGMRVLVFDPTLNGGFVCAARFWNESWWANGLGQDEMFPTVWQHLPPPPGEG